MLNKVFVEQNNRLIELMFIEDGWSISKPEEADLICFSGGSDVCPDLYNQPVHETTGFDRLRDRDCLNLYRKFKGVKPFVGICRGSQFLNVVNGGELYQHVEGHAISGVHAAIDRFTKKIVEVTSTHHQMMIPSVDANVIMTANKSNSRQTFHEDCWCDPHPSMLDIEAVIYPQTKTLCYQPHPEFVKKGHPCRNTFFLYLEHLIKLKG